MKAEKLYREAWRLLNTRTPLYGDCGTLCGGACCDDGGNEDAGMYLFPGEEAMYPACPACLRIEESAFCYGAADTKALIAICDGTCVRAMRPLACRIFPLTPYKKLGQPLQIIMDPRAKAMCPLAQAAAISDLDPRFVRAVRLIFLVLLRNRQVAEFVEELSYLLDEQMQFYE